VQILSEQDMLDALDGVPEGATVFISYHVGRPPTERAIREAAPAKEAGLNLRHFVGVLSSVWMTKKSQVVMTVLCENRCNEDKGMQPPHYRTFNPSLGRLLALSVVHSPVES
jgi:hypothetical protein